MTHVNNADLSEISASYKLYGKDKQRRVLRKTLSNYMQKNPLTPSEFGIKIYKECIDDH